jgi:hypothetical protein
MLPAAPPPAPPGSPFGDRPYFPDLDPRPKVLVMGQSLWGLSLSLESEKDLRVRWTAPNSLKRDLRWAPSVLVYPSHTTDKVRWIVDQVSPKTRLVAVGESGLIRAQEEGADAVFCVTFEAKKPAWTPQQQEALIRGLKSPIWAGSRRPIQSTRNTLSMHLQGTYSGYQDGWFSDSKPVVVKNTGSGILCEAGAEGREVLRVLFRDARVRTFGGVDHPLRDVSGFLEGLPKAQLAVALQFPEFLLNSLELMGREPRAVELHGLNPCLFWLIVLALGKGRMSLDDAAEAVLTKQRVVLGRLLDLPGKASRAVNKVATRMVFSDELAAFNVDELRALLRQEGFVKSWLAWPTVPFAFFGYNEPEFARSAWLRAGVQVGFGEPLRDIGALYVDALRLGHMVNGDLRRLARCGTRADMEDLHNEWMDILYGQRRREKQVAVQFPPPPIPGTEGIEHISDGRGLYEEGEAMHHCVAIYLDSTARGHYAIYRVLSPERATLQLARSRRCPRWYIAELKGPCNRRVKPSTKAAIQDWLDEARRPSPSP